MISNKKQVFNPFPVNCKLYNEDGGCKNRGKIMM